MNEKLEDILKRTRARKPGFEYLLNHLSTIDHPVILETGCIRKLDDAEFDGYSTVIWDLFLQEHPGSGTSVDIDPKAVKLATSQVQCMEVVNADSLQYLYHRSLEQGPLIDVLYLDSLDFFFFNRMESAMHHLTELCLIHAHMKPGGLVAVDDCVGYPDRLSGKGMIIAKLMETLEKPLVHAGYQLIWKW